MFKVPQVERTIAVGSTVLRSDTRIIAVERSHFDILGKGHVFTPELEDRFFRAPDDGHFAQGRWRESR